MTIFVDWDYSSFHSPRLFHHLAQNQKMTRTHITIVMVALFMVLLVLFRSLLLLVAVVVVIERRAQQSNNNRRVLLSLVTSYPFDYRGSNDYRDPDYESISTFLTSDIYDDIFRPLWKQTHLTCPQALSTRNSPVVRVQQVYLTLAAECQLWKYLCIMIHNCKCPQVSQTYSILVLLPLSIKKKHCASYIIGLACSTYRKTTSVQTQAHLT